MRGSTRQSDGRARAGEASLSVTGRPRMPLWAPSCGEEAKRVLDRTLVEELERPWAPSEPCNSHVGP